MKPTEQIAREVIEGLAEEILAYANPINDNRLAAWMMAEARAKDLLFAVQDTVRTISARHNSTFEEDVERVQPALHPVFSTLTESMRRPA